MSDEELGNFVARFLVDRGIAKKDNVDLYVNEKTMSVWVSAFTHETAGQNNYEKLEHLGDAIIHALFTKMLIKVYPKGQQNEYTKLRIYYTSNVVISKYSKTLGFDEFIRYKGHKKTLANLSADVFESFFGALDTVSDTIVDGLGILNCNKLMYTIYDEIDIKYGQLDKKTELNQIFQRLECPVPQTTTEKGEDDLYHTYIIFAEKHFELLENYGIDLIHDGIATALPLKGKYVIAEGSGNTAEVSSIAAYQNAMQILNSYGINEEWAIKAKNYMDLNSETMLPHKKELENKMIKLGYEMVSFSNPQKTTNADGRTMQLYGIKDDGSKVLLASNFFSDKTKSAQAKLELVLQFIRTKY